MKKLMMAIALSACSVARAGERVWPSLPDGVFPDTEVVTNIPLRVNAQRLQQYSLRLATGGAATNEVLVAVGHDADGNGDLAWTEAAFVFGADCGGRYLVNHETGRLFTDVEQTLTISHRFFNPAWNIAKVVKRGAGAVGETVTEMVENKKFAVILR